MRNSDKNPIGKQMTMQEELYHSKIKAKELSSKHVDVKPIKYLLK